MTALPNNSETVIEDTAQIQVPAGEAGKTTSSFVKDKIKMHKSRKRRSPSSRARKEIRASLAKVIRRAKSIAELLTEDDQEENLRVIREAKNACHVYITKKGEVHVPDHKTRLAAVALDLAYSEGKPVEKSITVSGDFEDLQSLLEAMKQSPAAQASLQKHVDLQRSHAGFAAS
jgi:hypothetical protein